MSQPTRGTLILTPSISVAVRATTDTRHRHGRLTPTEREILARLVAGQSNRAIAVARSSAVRTVANQVALLLRKMSVASRHELVASIAARSVATIEHDGSKALCFEHASVAYTVVFRPAAMVHDQPLKSRDRAILERIARGLSDEAIARRGRGVAD